MAKTKAELLKEYRDLKKENLNLTNTIRHLSKDEDERRALISELKQKISDWKEIAQKQNNRVLDLATKLDECEKEKTLIKSQRDVLLKEAEEHLYQINDLQESFDILQAEVRKIKINEEVIHDHAYEDGYADAEYRYKGALEQSNKELNKFIEHNLRLEWVISQIYENQNR